MWYVIDADPGSELIVGFTKDCTREEYLDALNQGNVEDLLQKVKVQKGDVIFIPAGLVHAIGKGIVVAEIQQSSDITYRIYDYNRKDSNGNERELHTEQALDVINFSAAENPKTKYTVHLNDITGLIECDYFTTNLISLNEPLTRNFGTIDSFITYMCMEGSLIIESGTDKIIVNKGDTILIPASIDEIGLIPDNEATLLEVYIQ
jgi:mannose-6-phosphate isomerase